MNDFLETNVLTKDHKEFVHDTAHVPGEQISIHPIADIFPMLSDDQLCDLSLNIATHGLLEPIVKYEGKILDGRCRFQACKLADVEPRFAEYDGEDPYGIVLGRNLHRRHLNNAQRAMIAARAASLVLGGNQYSDGLPIGGAAKILNISPRSISRAKEILRDGIPELVEAVERGKRALSSAVEIARKPEAEQRAFLTAGASTPREKNVKVESEISVDQPTARTGIPELPLGFDYQDFTDANRLSWTSLESAWHAAEGFRQAWSEAPKVVRERFVIAVLQCAPLAKGSL